MHRQGNRVLRPVVRPLHLTLLHVVEGRPGVSPSSPSQPRYSLTPSLRKIRATPSSRPQVYFIYFVCKPLLLAPSRADHRRHGRSGPSEAGSGRAAARRTRRCRYSSLHRLSPASPVSRRVVNGDVDVRGCCEGYASRAQFGAFVRAHTREPDAFYIAFRDETVEDIQQSIALRRQVRSLLDTPSAGRLATILPILSRRESAWVRVVRHAIRTAGRSLGAAIARSIQALPIGVDLLRAVVRCGFKNVYAGTLRLIASLDRYVVFRGVNRLTRNRLPPQKSVYSSVALDNSSRPRSDRAGRRDSIGPGSICLRHFERMWSPRTSSR